MSIPALKMLCLLPTVWALSSAPSAAEDSAPWSNPVPPLSVEEIVASSPGDSSAVDSTEVSGGAKDSSAESGERKLPEGSPGRPAGLVLHAAEGEPVAEVRLVLEGEGREYSAVSDDYGLFRFEKIPPGTYELKAYKSGFSPFQKRQDIQEGVPVTWEVGLEPRILKGQLIEVKAPPQAGSELAMLQRRQQASGVMEGVGAEQISKSTDSDAGAIAKRLTGTSVVGGKYVFVRGLGERYTNMTLNGLPVPSPEKDKRVVPQDLFPASALETFAIYKTYSANLPADFAGGSIDLETKGIPDKNFLKLSVSTGGDDYWGDGRFLDFGEDRLTYPGGSAVSEYFGYDDGWRKRPDVPLSITSASFERAERAGFAAKFHNQLAMDTATLLPAQSYSLAMGRVYRLGEESRTGFLLNLGFKNDYSQQNRQRLRVESAALQRFEPLPNPQTGEVPWIVDGKTLERRISIYDRLPGGDSLPLEHVVRGLEQSRVEGTYESTLSGLFNWGYTGYNHKLWLKSLYANLSEDRAFYNYSLAVPGVSAGQENVLEERFVLEYERRSLLVGQFGGGHYLGASVLDSLAWAAGLARTVGEIPDSKKYAYIRETADSPVITYDIKQPWGTRQWEELEEQGAAARFDFDLVIPPAISEKPVFREGGGGLSDISLPKGKWGGLANLKGRRFDIVRYDWNGLPRSRDSTTDYGLVERVHNPDSVARYMITYGRGFQTTAKDYDSYEASEGSFATYLSLEQGFKLSGLPVGIQVGGRYEFYFLDFKAPFTGDAAIKNPKLRDERAIEVGRRDHLFYPAAGIDFELYPKTKTRLLYSRTQVRPEFRERAPVSFFDTEDEVDVVGNPDLVDTRIDNYDLRFDWFLPFNQVFSTSIFYKDFDKPIERVLDAVPSPNIRRFQNANSAYVYGLELEVDLKLGEMLEQTPLRSEFSRGWGFYANAAWMKSDVDIDTTQAGTVTLSSTRRPMLGQSPYLYNVKLTHEREWGGISVLNGALFNVAGKRIHDLGADGVPDTYEEPFPSLDYLGKFAWGRHQVDVKIKNLLNTRKTLSKYPDNHKRDYHSISDADRDVLYANSPRKFVIDEIEEGVGYALGYNLDF